MTISMAGERTSGWREDEWLEKRRSPQLGHVYLSLMNCPSVRELSQEQRGLIYCNRCPKNLVSQGIWSFKKLLC